MDPRGKMAGRGAYLCGDARCWVTALEDRSLERALKAMPSEEERAALCAYAAVLKGGDVKDTHVD
ncbi:MAG: hypothetical protein A2Y73_04755 [Chloroflexi bacterium RBG_13_56_8]|nr:MAG: hypothetical protein A2Y73_04755 [Chloroflexi bacterium RBG_13_56_8]